MPWLLERVREANVDPEAVFRIYAEPSTWPSWGHNATRARADGPLTEGGIVFVRANYRRDYPCRVLRFEPGRALALEVRPPFLRVVNIYEVESVASGARIRHALEFSGPLSGPMRRLGVARMYGPQLDEEIAKVIALAKRSIVAGSADAEGG